MRIVGKLFWGLLGLVLSLFALGGLIAVFKSGFFLDVLVNLLITAALAAAAIGSWRRAARRQL